jgi:hypothetical protein
MSKGSSFDSGKKAASFSHYKLIFDAVSKAYFTTKNSHPVVACNPDRDAPCQSRPLTFAGIDYAVDVENATATALKDQPTLQSTWFRLIAGDTTVDPALAMRTIRACGKMYELRGLDPGEYFRKTSRAPVAARRVA